MNEVEYNRLMEKSRRGKLNSGEAMELEAYHATRPELRTAWEDEQALNQLLGQLPAAPVASNFTSRVMQAVAVEARPAPVALPWWRQVFGFSWARPVAAACLLVAAGLLSLHQYHASERARLAVALRQFSQAPSVETLKDFDAITRLGQASQFVDADLLTVPE